VLLFIYVHLMVIVHLEIRLGTFFALLNYPSVGYVILAEHSYWKIIFNQRALMDWLMFH
jgi:hypothetical protein